jgi:hypothetical protein
MPVALDVDRWAALGGLLQQRRVELDRRYRNRKVFAEERKINYRLVQDMETGARKNYELSTLTDADIAYGWAPGSIRAILAGAAPPVPDLAADDRPQVVREHWSDDRVRQIWRLANIPPGAKAGLVVALLDLDEQSQAEASG